MCYTFMSHFPRGSTLELGIAGAEVKEVVNTRPGSTIISIWKKITGEWETVIARNESNRKVRSAQGEREPGVGDSIQDDRFKSRSGGGVNASPPFYSHTNKWDYLRTFVQKRVRMWYNINIKGMGNNPPSYHR